MSVEEFTFTLKSEEPGFPRKRGPIGLKLAKNEDTPSALWLKLPLWSGRDALALFVEVYQSILKRPQLTWDEQLEVSINSLLKKTGWELTKSGPHWALLPPAATPSSEEEMVQLIEQAEKLNRPLVLRHRSSFSERLIVQSGFVRKLSGENLVLDSGNRTRSYGLKRIDWISMPASAGAPAYASPSIEFKFSNQEDKTVVTMRLGDYFSWVPEETS